MTGQCIDVVAPDYVFAVKYSDDVDKKFDQLRGDRRVMCAYHGSRLENFHSILHYGLQGHLNKVNSSLIMLFALLSRSAAVTFMSCVKQHD